MASSNATVEKLKAVGLKHGEKAVVGLAVTLFLIFVVLAIAKPSIDLRPEDLQKKAESADSNLSRRQNAEDILAKLESLGIKPKTEFETTVVAQHGKPLNAADYLVKSKWVTPEPGAGMIRSQPVLLAPTDLVAFPNRGATVCSPSTRRGNASPTTARTRSRRRSGSARTAGAG